MAKRIKQFRYYNADAVNENSPSNLRY